MQDGMEWSRQEAKRRGLQREHFCDYLLFLDADQVRSAGMVQYGGVVYCYTALYPADGGPGGCKACHAENQGHDIPIRPHCAAVVQEGCAHPANAEEPSWLLASH